MAALIAALGTLGPFSVDTYLPAFEGIASDLHATPLQMQQTLSAYLFGFAFMMLFHGALADSFGRKPVMLVNLVLFAIASAGCALAQDIGELIAFRALQGISAGAGIAVGRALIRDLFPATEAQKVMSQSTLFFGIAPAVAPIVGGYLYVYATWQAIFWFLCAVGAVLTVLVWRTLPETLPREQRHAFHVKPLLHGYREVGLDGRFWLLSLASGVPFNAMFIYILSAPVFAGQHLGLTPTQFFWLFVCTISGIMAGAFTSGRFAGRVSSARQIRMGFGVMLAACAVNLLYSALTKAAVPWAIVLLWPIAYGWALVVPAVTILVLDSFPARRGMVSSLQSFVGGTTNGLVAGVLTPLVMGSSLKLAATAVLLTLAGIAFWFGAQRLATPSVQRSGG